VNIIQGKISIYIYIYFKGLQITHYLKFKMFFIKIYKILFIFIYKIRMVLFVYIKYIFLLQNWKKKRLLIV